MATVKADPQYVVTPISSQQFAASNAPKANPVTVTNPVSGLGLFSSTFRRLLTGGAGIVAPVGAPVIASGSDVARGLTSADTTSGTEADYQPTATAYLPSGGVQFASNPGANSGGGAVSSAGKGLLIFALLFGGLLAFGQGSTDTTFYVKSFRGSDVGAKISNAMVGCPQDGTPCFLIVDPSLAKFAAGTIPNLCSSCYVIDYRQGPAQISTPGSTGYTIVASPAKPVPPISKLGTLFTVTDGVTPQDCTTGGGLNQNVCINTLSGPQVIQSVAYPGVTSNGVNGLSATGPMLSQSFDLAANENATPWASVFQSAATAPATELVIGDSISNGSGATPDTTYGWANGKQLYGDLQQAFPGSTSNHYVNSGNYCGVGALQSAQCSVTTTGTWTGVPGAVYQASGPTIYSIYKATSSATACTNFSYADNFTVYYYTSSDSGTFTVKVNGSTVGTFGGTTTGSLTPASSVSVSLTPNGSVNTACVVAPSSGYVYLFGVNVTAGTTGVREWNVSAPGAASGAYAYDTSWMTWLPSHVAAIVALGQNDGWTASTITPNLSTIVTALTAKSIPIVGVITEPPNSQSSGMDANVNSVLQWYQTQTIPVVNVYRRIGSYAAGNAQGWYADGIHPTTYGHSDFKLAFEDKVLPSLPSLILQNSTPKTYNMPPSTTMLWQGLVPIWQYCWPGAGCYQVQVLGDGSTYISTAHAQWKDSSSTYDFYDSGATHTYMHLANCSDGTNSGCPTFGSAINLSSSFGTGHLQVLGDGSLYIYGGGAVHTPNSFGIDNGSFRANIVSSTMAATQTFTLPATGGTFALVLTGTSASIGGSALTAGQCASGTATISGVTTSMVAKADPNTYPGDGYVWQAYIASSGSVTVKVCAIAAGTPTASTYNVRVIL